jgi:Do/DeqQ family serine protease
MRPFPSLFSALLAVTMVTAGAAFAQQPAPAMPQVSAEKAVPASRGEVQLSFAPVVRKVAPAVVNIYTKKVELKRQRSPLLDDPIWRRFFPDDFASGGPVRKQVRTSLGSGVIVNASGLIVTNVHVVRGAEEIRVILADRREFDARVVLADPRTDLAVLRIDTHGEKLSFIEFFDSEKLEVGDLVLAIGNPFGVGQTVTSGIVSALARTTIGVTDYRFFIQTDAAINPGNSGGALVTMDGRLAGINTAIFTKTGGSVGLGFAVPSAMVKAVVAGVASGGKLVRPWLGVSGQRVTSAIAASIGMARPRGVIIGKVHPESPAASAGLRLGDVVTAVNGLDVDDDQALRFRFATLPASGEARLTVIRGGREISVPVKLVRPPEVPPRDSRRIDGNNPLSGATVVNLSPAVADALGLPDDTRGVIIISVAGNSTARRVGFLPRDVIRAVNTETVTSTGGLADYLTQADGMPRWRVTFERKGRTLTVVTGGGG